MDLKYDPTKTDTGESLGISKERGKEVMALVYKDIDELEQQQEGKSTMIHHGKFLQIVAKYCKDEQELSFFSFEAGVLVSNFTYSRLGL